MAMASLAWLDDFIDSWQVAVGAMDFSTLRPFTWLQMHPLYAVEWCENMAELARGLGENRVSRADYAALGLGSGVFRDQLFYLLWDFKSARLPFKEREKIIRPFHEMNLASTFADPYGFTSNIQHSPEQVRLLLHEIPWQTGEPEHARLLGKLYTGALHLVHGLYGDIYVGNSADNFGAYDASGKYGKGHSLVIRNFADLKPLEVWSGAGAIPCKTLDIYTVYRKVRFTCDAISCHSVFDGNVIENLVDFAVKVDGKFVDSTAALAALKDDLTEHAVGQWKELVGKDFEDLKQTGLTQRSYINKPLYELAGMDWRPTKAMRQAVKGKPFADESYWGVPKKNQKSFWHKMMDPCIDFYPPGVAGT